MAMLFAAVRDEFWRQTHRSEGWEEREKERERERQIN